jgi:hypothetical protein
MSPAETAVNVWAALFRLALISSLLGAGSSASWPSKAFTTGPSSQRSRQPLGCTSMWEHASPRHRSCRRSSSRISDAPRLVQQDRPSVRIFVQTKSRRRGRCSFTLPPLRPGKAAALGGGILAHADTSEDVGWHSTPLTLLPLLGATPTARRGRGTQTSDSERRTDSHAHAKPWAWHPTWKSCAFLAEKRINGVGSCRQTFGPV